MRLFFLWSRAGISQLNTEVISDPQRVVAAQKAVGLTRQPAAILSCAIAFLAGHCVVHTLTTLPRPALWGSALLLVTAIALRLRYVVLVCFFLGIAWAWSHAAWRLEHDLPIALEGRDIELQGDVVSLPETTQGQVRFVFEIKQAQLGAAERPAFNVRRVELTWYDTTVRPAAGERWQLTARMKRRHGFANPGGFDFERQLFANGINATGYVRESSSNRRLALPTAGSGVLQTRAWIAQGLATALPDSDMLGILQGLAVGDTQRMTHDQWRIFAATGITHLMAISGLHIAMVAGVFAALGGLVARRTLTQQSRWTAHEIHALAGLCGAIIYCLLAGMSVPTQRTFVMLCVYFLTRLSRRVVSAADIFGVAMMAVLLVDPFAVLTPGMWLSFGAVAAIVMVSAGRVGITGKMQEFTRVQAAVTIALLPLVMCSFGQMSLVSPLVNAIAIPFFTLLVVPLVLIATVLLPFSVVVSGWVLAVPDSLLHFAWPALQWTAQLPWALYYFTQASGWALACLVPGVVMTLLPIIWPVRMAGVLLCLPALTATAPVLEQGAFKLTVLDVGQGLAVVVQTTKHTLIYDTGPSFRSGRDAAELVVLPFLHAAGVHVIDRVMVSHGDDDHAGGLASILKLARVNDVVLGPSVKQSPPNSSRCNAGDTWTWDGVNFSLLNPDAATMEFDNDSSCVLHIAGTSVSALLTGDIEKRAEQGMLAAQTLQPVDIVVAPHHGSKTSSSTQLVAALQPRFVVFSTGYRNRWGFPKAEIRDRWRSIGAETADTSQAGAVTFVSTAQGVSEPALFRKIQHRYWWAD